MSKPSKGFLLKTEGTALPPHFVTDTNLLGKFTKFPQILLKTKDLRSSSKFCLPTEDESTAWWPQKGA